MSNLQKFIRLKPLSMRILIFITFFIAIFPELILSQDTKRTQTYNALQEFDIFNPFKICWKLKNEELIYYSVASDKDKNLLVSSVGGIIKSLNSESGDKRWETDLGGEILSTPYIDGKNLYIVSKPKENQNEISTSNEVSANDYEKNIIIRSLSVSSGVTIWQTNLKTNLNPEQIFLYIHKSTLLIVDRNGNMYSIYKNDGIFNWQKTLDVKLSAPPYFYADKAILGTLEKQLIIFNLGEGKTYKKIELRVIPTAISFNTNDETLIVGDQRGIVSSIKTEKIDFKISNKEKKNKNNSWKFRLGAEVSNISFTPRGLLVTSLDNFAYLISAEKGNLIWKKRLTGRISEKSLVLDNYALLTTIAEPTISVVELSTGRLINKIILEDENFVTDNPIKIQNKIIVPASKGLYAFSPNECYKIEN
jgi:outer membrane protein assembly factor BamB